jgi:hypothetical protein
MISKEKSLLDKITGVLGSIGSKKCDVTSATMDEEVLCIDCRNCNQLSDPKSMPCINCMISSISELGNAERIKLRSGRDTEISGRAAEIFCELTDVTRFSDLKVDPVRGRSCAGCEYSPERILDLVQADFPDLSFEQVRSKLMVFRPEGHECSLCLQKTYRMLDQVELSMEKIRKKVFLESERNGGR